MPNRGKSIMQDAGTGRFTSAKTFADMVRLIGVDDAENEDESPAQPSASLAGMVKLQQNRTRVDSGGDDDVFISTAENVDRVQLRSKATPSPCLVPPRQHLSEACLDVGNVLSAPFGQHVSSGNQKEHNHPLPSPLDDDRERDIAAARPGADDPDAEMFGKLPDPIHLHARLGDFDGQVIFIGHPNRDVSAHQWSSSSFQWQNMGRYSQSRGKVEGALASDLVKTYGGCDNTLLHFRIVAKNRERLVVDGRRTCQAADKTIWSNAPTNIGTMNKANIKRTATEGFADVTHGKMDLNQPPKTASARPGTQVKRDLLDDPFLTEARCLKVIGSGRAQSGSRVAIAQGSLNLEYEFPTKTTDLSHPPTSIANGPATHGRQETLTSSWCGAKTMGPLSHSTLRDISFGEEASSGGALLDTTRSTSVCDDYSTRADAQAHGHIAASRYVAFQATARSLFPAVGPTVANPHHGLPRLDYTAMAYRNGPSQATSSGASEVYATMNTVGDTAALQFSDPDGSGRQGQEHEITNGLSQQVPTIQNFKGPFFTESKPTAHDPTASLSIHVSEEEKLRSWFCDGHRPARQRAHAMTLVSASIVGGQSQCFSNVRQTMGGTDKSRFENTTPFVRLYEGLSEYVEEYCNGGGGSYFSRAWKAAPSQMRDFDTNGNNSYFTEAMVVPSRYC